MNSAGIGKRFIGPSLMDTLANETRAPLRMQAFQPERAPIALARSFAGRTPDFVFGQQTAFPFIPVASPYFSHRLKGNAKLGSNGSQALTPQMSCHNLLSFAESEGGWHCLGLSHFHQGYTIITSIRV